jgi:hypothetical protein
MILKNSNINNDQTKIDGASKGILLQKDRSISLSGMNKKNGLFNYYLNTRKTLAST